MGLINTMMKCLHLCHKLAGQRFIPQTEDKRSPFEELLATRSNAHIRTTIHEFEALSGCVIDDCIALEWNSEPPTPMVTFITMLCTKIT